MKAGRRPKGQRNTRGRHGTDRKAADHRDRCAIDQDHPHFVSFDLGGGSSSLALDQREAAAQDAGVSPAGSGFRGVSFHFIVPSSEAVDEAMGRAVAAGGGVVKQAAASPWGYFGYFSDPGRASSRSELQDKE